MTPHFLYSLLLPSWLGARTTWSPNSLPSTFDHAAFSGNLNYHDATIYHELPLLPLPSLWKLSLGCSYMTDLNPEFHCMSLFPGATSTINSVSVRISIEAKNIEIVTDQRCRSVGNPGPVAVELLPLLGTNFRGRRGFWNWEGESCR